MLCQQPEKASGPWGDGCGKGLGDVPGEEQPVREGRNWGLAEQALVISWTHPGPDWGC